MDGRRGRPRGPRAGLHGPGGFGGASDAVDAGTPPMIWLTWRQFRTQILVVAGVLAVLAIVLALTGPHLVSLSDALPEVVSRRQGLRRRPPIRSSPRTAARRCSQRPGHSAPALIGIFWGAPLIARELETGTYRLAWTQIVTRRRWLAVKLGVVGLASVAVAGLLSLMVTWWSSPIDRRTSNSSVAIFALRDIAPIGYAAFAFAVGVTAGCTHTPDAAGHGRHARRLRGGPGRRDRLAPTAPATPGTHVSAITSLQPDRILPEPVGPPGDGQSAEHAQRVGHLD